VTGFHVNNEKRYILWLLQSWLRGLVDDLESIGYLEIQNGEAYITKKGESKLEDFKASLSEEEKKALAL
jgi:ribosomal protein S19E (S16A)